MIMPGKHTYFLFTFLNCLNKLLLYNFFLCLLLFSKKKQIANISFVFSLVFDRNILLTYCASEIAILRITTSRLASVLQSCFLF